MPHFEYDGVRIEYALAGSGYPVLAFAPGGMRSAFAKWVSPAPWNPLTELAGDFRVIAMDQRNAGASTAPISGDDGWHSYARDHLALLDHLGIERCHVLGGCIGGAFALKLIETAPERVQAAVLQQPIGLEDNRHVFHALFDDWRKEIEPKHPEASESAWASFRDNMYGGDFVFSVGRDVVRSATSPMLVLMGNDVYHPSSTSREIVQLAKQGELVERWKDAEVLPQTVARVRAFFHQHTPS